MLDGTTRCPRCWSGGQVWLQSYFTGTMVCPACIQEELRVVRLLEEAGKDPGIYEACGYVPIPPRPVARG